MNSLDLYARFEPLIGFENEKAALHQKYITILKQHHIKTALDIGCGSGDALIKMEANGICATGIDLSGEMITKATAQGANAKQLNIADMHEEFDAATAMFDVINYLTADQLENFFICVRKCVKNIFVFDINSLYGFSEVAAGDLVLQNSTKHATVQSTFELSELINEFNLFEPNEAGKYERFSWQITQYYHTDLVIKNALFSAGFEAVKTENLYLYNMPKADKILFTAAAHKT